MDNTQTTEFEDRSYYILGNMVYNRPDFIFTLKCMGYSEKKIEEKMKFAKGSVNPFWVDLLRKGYKQYQIILNRDREVLFNNERTQLLLYYNSTSPWAWWFKGPTEMTVISLSKDSESAIVYANKKLTEQYLNPKWLVMTKNDFEEIGTAKGSFGKSLWPGINNFYSNQLTP